MANVDSFPIGVPVFRKRHSKVANCVLFHREDDKKFQRYFTNGFEFGRRDYGLLNASTCGSKMFGHDVAGANELCWFARMKT